MAFFSRKNDDTHFTKEVEVQRLDVSKVKNFDPRPLHEQYLSEMESKRDELLAKDAEIVDTINRKNRELASVRMALRGVEDMMASIRKNPITPSTIESVSEFRERSKAKIVAASASTNVQQMQSRVHRPGQQPAEVVEVSEDTLIAAISSSYGKVEDTLEQELEASLNMDAARKAC